MARRKMTAGKMNQMLPLFIQDTTSTTGAGLGSLVYNSAGLAAKYRREGQSSWTTIALQSPISGLGTWTSGGFIADGGSVTGGYEFGVPDAAVAAGATWVTIQIYGATNMLAIQLEITLDVADYQVAAFGASTLTQAQVTGGAYAINSSSFAFNSAMDFTTTQKAATLARVTLVDTTTTATGGATASALATLQTTVDTINTATGTYLDATVSSRGTSTLTQTQVTGGAYALSSASFAFNSALDFTATQKAATLARVTLVDTTTTNTDMRGTDNAALAATALSTATWTGTLATNLGTTNATVATNLDAAVSSRGTSTYAGADTAGTTTLLSRVTGSVMLASSYTAPLDATSTRSAIGLATANLDSQLALKATQASVDDLPTNAELAIALGAADDAVLARLGSPVGASIAADIAAISSSAGTGARTVAITINDGSAVLENASVRLTNGAETYVTSTNASGVATLYVDDATWSVSVTKSGYSYAGTTIVVNGNETATYSMTLVAIIPAASPSQCTGYGYCYSAAGVPVSGVVVTVKQQTPTSGGILHAHEKQQATSNGLGLVQFSNLFRGAQYELRKGSSAKIFTVPSTGSSFEMPSIVG